jgi:hypothetical protein
MAFVLAVGYEGLAQDAAVRAALATWPPNDRVRWRVLPDTMAASSQPCISRYNRRNDMRRNTLAAVALAALTALSLPGVVDAQDPQPERGRMGQRGMPRPGVDPATHILELREELALTQSQIDRIGSIATTLEERNAPLLAQLTAAREQMIAERQELTPEQREAARERREATRDSMRARAGQMTPEEREEMRGQMRARMEERGGKVRPRAAGTPRQRMPDELRPAMEQLQSNTQEAMEQIRSVLTEEQQQKLRELRPARRQRGPAMQRTRRDGNEGRPPVAPGVRPQGAPGSR